MDCAGCETRHDVHVLRVRLRDALEDQLVGIIDSILTVAVLGVPPGRNRVNYWAATGGWCPAAATRRGRALYRAGDVLDLAAAKDARREARFG